MNMIIAAIKKAGLNRALIRDELVAMADYKGVTGRKNFDAVLTNRTPATLAVLQNGRFEFFSRKEVFADHVDFSYQ